MSGPWMKTKMTWKCLSWRKLVRAILQMKAMTRPTATINRTALRANQRVNLALQQNCSITLGIDNWNCLHALLILTIDIHIDESKIHAEMSKMIDIDNQSESAGKWFIKFNNTHSMTCLFFSTKTKRWIGFRRNRHFSRWYWTLPNFGQRFLW